MTVIFIIVVLMLVSSQIAGKKNAKPALAVVQPKVPNLPAPDKQPSVGVFRHIHAALHGEKALMVELTLVKDGLLKHKTRIRVQWMNATTCHAEDGLPHHQFLMMLEDGKRVSLPIFLGRDGKHWVTYQGKDYNGWADIAHVRCGLFETLGCKATSRMAKKCEPVFG